MGVPTLIIWVGTDVLRGAPKASREVVERAWHWCVAPWLRDELAEVGIEAPVVRLTPPQVPDRTPRCPRISRSLPTPSTVGATSTASTSFSSWQGGDPMSDSSCRRDSHRWIARERQGPWLGERRGGGDGRDHALRPADVARRTFELGARVPRQWAIRPVDLPVSRSRTCRHRGRCRSFDRRPIPEAHRRTAPSQRRG